MDAATLKASVATLTTAVADLSTRVTNQPGVLLSESDAEQLNTDLVNLSTTVNAIVPPVAG